MKVENFKTILASHVCPRHAVGDGWVWMLWATPMEIYSSWREATI